MTDWLAGCIALQAYAQAEGIFKQIKATQASQKGDPAAGDEEDKAAGGAGATPAEKRTRGYVNFLAEADKILNLQREQKRLLEEAAAKEAKDRMKAAKKKPKPA